MAGALSLASDAAEQSERVATLRRKVEETGTVLRRRKEEERKAADRLATDREGSARAQATLAAIRQDQAYRTEVRKGHHSLNPADFCLVTKKKKNRASSLQLFLLSGES